MARVFALLVLSMGLSLAAKAGQPQPVVSPAAMQAAATSSHVRVVVMLRMQAPQPLPAPGVRSAQLQGSQVRELSDRVLAALPASGFRLRRRFSLVPALVLEADARTLQALARNPEVQRVDIDAGGGANAAPPDESSVLNKVSDLQSLGLDGRGMKVAVIDSGVDTDHPDLRSRLLDEACFCSVNDLGPGGCCPGGATSQFGAGAAEDNNGHGTNVAGIIVGEGSEAPRGALPTARLIAVKVLDRNGRYCCSSDVVAALDWIATQHPDVAAVNLSLGSNVLFNGDCDAGTAWTQAFSAAIDVLVARGAVVTASSGNDGNLAAMEAPACIRKAVSVAATWDFSGGPITFLGCSENSTAPMQPTCFSNRSTTTDLFAAGAFVRSTGYNGHASSFGGTSQAAPMVAACAVALKQAAPAATVAQRMDAMTLSQTRLQDPASGRTYPFLDCVDAVRLLNPTVLAPIPLNDSQPLLPPSTPLPTSRLPALFDNHGNRGPVQDSRGGTPDGERTGRRTRTQSR